MPTTLHTGFKHPGRTLAVTSVAGLPHHCRLFYTVKNVVYQNTPGEQYFHVSMVTHTVTTETVKYCSPGMFSYTTFFTVYVCDHTTGSRFLVDTGAEVSVVPPLCTERLHQHLNLNLQATNSATIATYGIRSLNLRLRHTFRWAFVVADVKQPIIGADFLKHFGLQVDMRLLVTPQANTMFAITLRPLGRLSQAVPAGLPQRDLKWQDRNSSIIMLEQDQWQPTAYFSKALKPASTRYSTFDRELLAIYLSLLSISATSLKVDSFMSSTSRLPMPSLDDPTDIRLGKLGI